MTSMTMLACSQCWNPIGAGARPVYLGDLAFHPICAPRCRACDSVLSDTDDPHWTYEGLVVWEPTGYVLRPTESWCEGCAELHDRNIAFAQD